MVPSGTMDHFKIDDQYTDVTGFTMRKAAVILPDLGTGPDTPIVVSYWFAARGETVWEGERLVEVLVGPATFDVPAPATGRLVEIRCGRTIRCYPGPCWAASRCLTRIATTNPTTSRIQAATITTATRVTGPGGQVIAPHDHLSRTIRRHHPVPPGETKDYCTWSSIRPPFVIRCQVGIPQGWRRARRIKPPDGRPRIPGRDGPDGLVVSGRFRAQLLLYVHSPGTQGRQDRGLLSGRGRNSAHPTRSEEHVEDPHGQWFHWGTFEEINELLYHSKIRQVFAEADAWLRK